MGMQRDESGLLMLYKFIVKHKKIQSSGNVPTGRGNQMKLSKLMKASLFVLSSALVLGACGSSKTEESSKTIEVWTAYTEGQPTATQTKEMIKSFEKETGYKVNQTNFTYDMMHDKILASAAGGNLPDAVWGLPEYIGEFYNMGILEDLTEEFNDWDQKDNFNQSVINAMKIDKKIVGIPYESTVRAYLTHSKDFEAADATVPETWEDILSLTNFKDKVDKYPYSFAGKGVREPQELLVYLAQYDLKIAEEQDGGKYKNTWQENPAQLEKAAKVFQFYQDMISEKVADPNSANLGWEETDENFATGVSASYVTGNWLQEREESNPDVMEDVEVHAIPYPSDGKKATYLEAKPVFVFNAGKNKEGAIELAKAFASKEYQEKAFLDRSPRTDVSGESKWSKDYQALSDTGVTFPPVTISSISQNMIDSLAKVLQDNEEPEVAAKWLSDEINKSLQESGEYAE